jgi:hypothetical protein
VEFLKKFPSVSPCPGGIVGREVVLNLYAAIRCPRKARNDTKGTVCGISALVPKVSEALWERIGEAKLRFAGRRVRMGTAFEVVAGCNGDGVSGVGVPKALR